MDDDIRWVAAGEAVAAQGNRFVSSFISLLPRRCLSCVLEGVETELVAMGESLQHSFNLL